MIGELSVTGLVLRLVCIWCHSYFFPLDAMKPKVIAARLLP